MVDKKIMEAMRFYLLATKLKDKIRSGWNNRHWNINKDRVESVAEHVYGTCILAISLDSQFDFSIDLNRVLKMLVIHEIGEVIIGDITPFEGVTKEMKNKIEHEAMIEIIGDLIKKDELISLLFEFDKQETKDAKFAHCCDKLEADLQSKIYQDTGCHHSLYEQDDNIAFKSPKIKDMIDAGAKKPFDIWYLWDEELYDDAPIFKRTLKFIKDFDTNI